MHEPISFHNGIDGTAAIVRQVLAHEPMDGAFFVFLNRRRHSLRILCYDGSGFWLCTKRLSHGRFRSWPGSGTGPENADQTVSSLLARELQILIWGGNPAGGQFPDLWRKVA